MKYKKKVQNSKEEKENGGRIKNSFDNLAISMFTWLSRLFEERIYLPGFWGWKAGRLGGSGRFTFPLILAER